MKCPSGDWPSIAWAFRFLHGTFTTPANCAANNGSATCRAPPDAATLVESRRPEDSVKKSQNNPPTSPSELVERPVSTSSGGLKLGDVRLWDAQTGRELLTFSFRDGANRYLANFTTDGNRLVVHAGNTVKIYDATPLAGTGLKELAGLEHLQSIELRTAPVTDAGLGGLAGLRQLRTLGLQESKVTGAGLKQLAGLKKLQSLNLSQSPITRLDGLAGLEQLRSLELYGTKISDAELKELSALKQLESLNLEGNPVTDLGLKELAGLTQLQSLHLGRTAVTIAGLKELRGFKKLQWLHLPGQVTDAAVVELQKALPAARIMPDRPM